MDSAWWLALLLAVPIGIATNLLTPQIAKVGARYNSRLRRRLDERTQRQRQRAEEYVDDPSSYESYLMLAILRTTLIYAIGGVVSSPFALAAYSVPNRNLGAWFYLWDVLFGISQLVNLVATIAVLNIAREAMKTVSVVRNIRAERRQALRSSAEVAARQSGKAEAAASS
ncbi:hypothetical protein IRY44_21950 [Micromonospora sp. ANENR4]|uniref:hypothetical protein n=1 Tax=Micromonospora sp. ANENR4 TaxID=2783662 RepID=UPI00188FA74E|nr:hypothetical protein [Micromonospora sp. ANENR4]MBF5032422.1 hypothetical protein [Micromonospora sp. ANENR4]